MIAVEQAPVLVDPTWFVVAGFVMLAVIAGVLAWLDRRPRLFVGTLRAPSAGDAGVARPSGSPAHGTHGTAPEGRARVRSIVDWSMSQASTGYGSVDLVADPPSLAELEAGFLYGAVCTSPTFDENRLSEAWQELEDVCGSTERALLVDTRCRETRRREAAADVLLSRAIGGLRS